MNFAPKTKEELETMNLLKPGNYHFSVANAKDKTSKNGNEMIELNLDVYDDAGNARPMFDYLLEAMPQKLFAFCVATEMESKYHTGRLTSGDCIGKSAYVEVTVQKGQENPQGGQYPDKNVVKRYLPKVKYETRAGATRNDEEQAFDTDVPF